MPFTIIYTQRLTFKHIALNSLNSGLFEYVTGMVLFIGHVLNPLEN
ncbi:unnamed protein product [Rhodiola kirilowii]